MKKLLAAILIIICAYASVARADIAPEKRKEIERMLKLTGMEKLMAQVKGQMINSLKREMPNVPEDFWTRFEKKMDVHELTEKIIPLYDKYYTLDDLKAVNAFYASPAGQKVMSTMPQLMQESMKIGQEWGEKIGKQAAEEVQKESGGK
jgi:hypothetical protein